jgi:hypothetical protein
MNDSVWETLEHRRKIARICTVFKAYTREQAWQSIWDRLKGPCYVSRGDHNRKIRARKQRTDIGKYSSVKRTNCGINFACKAHIFRKRVRKVILNDEK